jgi:UDP-glucose 4-epimerase
MKIAVVTGGCGFIGSHIVDRLVKDDYIVRVIDDLSAPENETFYHNKNAQYFKLDISKDDCSEAFKDADYVFHLAARSRIQPTIGSPNECFKVNVVGTQRVLEWARINSVKRVIYSGTSSLYGHQNKPPFNRNMTPDCLNPYSTSKWMGEEICKMYNKMYNLPSIVLRYFNVYGPREPIKGNYAPVVGLFKRQFKEDMPPTIVSPGTQRRDFTYINDVVEANILAMSSSTVDIPFGVYNVGTGVNYNMFELAQMIYGKPGSGGWSDVVDMKPPRPAEVKETLADIDSTMRDLGWFPKFKLEDMINSY